MVGIYAADYAKLCVLATWTALRGAIALDVILSDSQAWKLAVHVQAQRQVQVPRLLVIQQSLLLSVQEKMWVVE